MTDKPNLTNPDEPAVPVVYAEPVEPIRHADMRRRVVFHTDGPSMTKQASKDETDINVIMKRFEKTGVISHLNRYEGNYSDFTNVPQSYHDAMNQVVQADEMFMTIPANIRAKFDNDPGAFLAFVENPENEDKLVEMGLAKARPPVQPEPPVPPVPPEGGPPPAVSEEPPAQSTT